MRSPLDKLIVGGERVFIAPNVRQEFCFAPIRKEIIRIEANDLIIGRQRLIEPLIHCDLLILDEFGYLSVEPQVGPVLYEIISGRYEKGATVITSNKSLASWGELVGDTALMMAILDRLLHHGEVFYVRRSSYRLRGKEPVTLIVKGDMLSAAEML